MLYNTGMVDSIILRVVAPSLTPDALQCELVNLYRVVSCSSLSHPGCSTIPERARSQLVEL